MSCGPLWSALDRLSPSLSFRSSHSNPLPPYRVRTLAPQLLRSTATLSTASSCGPVHQAQPDDYSLNRRCCIRILSAASTVPTNTPVCKSRMARTRSVYVQEMRCFTTHVYRVAAISAMVFSQQLGLIAHALLLTVDTVYHLHLVATMTINWQDKAVQDRLLTAVIASFDNKVRSIILPFLFPY
jgi:hypothetical protein